MFDEKLLRTSPVSNSLLIIWLFSNKFILSLKIISVFTVFKKVCYHLCPFHSSLKNNSFWIFLEDRHSDFFALYARPCFLSVLFLRKVLYSLNLFIFAVERSFIINGIWLPQACFYSCLFKRAGNIYTTKSLEILSFVIKACFESFFNNDFLNASFEKCL